MMPLNFFKIYYCGTEICTVALFVEIILSELRGDYNLQIVCGCC